MFVNGITIFMSKWLNIDARLLVGLLNIKLPSLKYSKYWNLCPSCDETQEIPLQGVKDKQDAQAFVSMLVQRVQQHAVYSLCNLA